MTDQPQPARLIEGRYLHPFVPSLENHTLCDLCGTTLGKPWHDQSQRELIARLRADLDQCRRERDELEVLQENNVRRRVEVEEHHGVLLRENVRLRGDFDYCRRDNEVLKAVANAAKKYRQAWWLEQADEVAAGRDLDVALAALDPDPGSAHGEQEKR